jgi:hypothetical protein
MAKESGRKNATEGGGLVVLAAATRKGRREEEDAWWFAVASKVKEKRVASWLAGERRGMARFSGDRR